MAALPRSGTPALERTAPEAPRRVDLIITRWVSEGCFAKNTANPIPHGRFGL